MRKAFSKVLILFIAMVLLIGSFTIGCTPKDSNQLTGPSSDESSEKGTDNTNNSEDAKPEENQPVTLTYFWNMDAKASMSMKSYEEIACFKEAKEQTGVNIEWKHPPAGQGTEQFNLMLASQDLPDLIFWGWRGITGGPAKAIADGSILKLNDIIEEHAPNFNAVLEANPDWKKEAVLDDGSLYMFPFIRGDMDLRMNAGFQIRKDWLDQLNLEIPKSIDDWYTVLTAFKEKDMNNNGNPDDELPFVSAGLGSVANFARAWGIVKGFYKNGDGVKYGPVQPEYKEYLATMAKWYAEGLIDPDFAATDGTSFDAKVTGSLGGSYHGMVSGNMGRFTQSVRPNEPEFELAGVPFPIGPIGKAYGFIDPSVINAGTAITTSCQHKPEAAEYLDYGYGEEGHMAFNFGTEGESYTLVDGEPKYTDIVLKNPELPIPNALIRYAMSIGTGSFVQDVRYLRQILTYPEQQEALKIWITGSDMSLNMPPVTLTAEESQKYANIMSEINTYVDEMTTKFIMGEESLDKFDQFANQIGKMKIDEALKIQQAALERYNAR